MNILILAAGHIYLEATDSNYPLCIAEIDDKLLIEHLLHAGTAIGSPRFVVALRDLDVKKYHLDNIVQLLAPGATVVRVPENTRGAACSALLAIRWIDNDDELLILNGNELLDVDYPTVLNEFRARQLDAGTLTFPSVHPRYSYVRLGEDHLVVEAAEKNPISRLATAGFYWFARGRDFVRASQSMIRKDASVNDLFYICPALNELVLEQARIGTYSIDGDCYHPLKTHLQISQYAAALNQSMLNSGERT